MCLKKPVKDPCKFEWGFPRIPSTITLLTYFSPPNLNKPKHTLAAYASNYDVDDFDYPMINLCHRFFDMKNLKDAITYGTTLNSAENLRPSRYDNRAQTFFVSVYSHTRGRGQFSNYIKVWATTTRYCCWLSTEQPSYTWSYNRYISSLEGSIISSDGVWSLLHKTIGSMDRKPGNW